MKITVSYLIEQARILKSENTENPEYDRALCELIEMVGDGLSTDKTEIAKTLNIDSSKLW